VRFSAAITDRRRLRAPFVSGRKPCAEASLYGPPPRSDRATRPEPSRRSRPPRRATPSRWQQGPARPHKPSGVRWRRPFVPRRTASRARCRQGRPAGGRNRRSPEHATCRWHRRFARRHTPSRSRRPPCDRSRGSRSRARTGGLRPRRPCTHDVALPADGSIRPSSDDAKLRAVERHPDVRLDLRHLGAEPCDQRRVFRAGEDPAQAKRPRLVAAERPQAVQSSGPLVDGFDLLALVGIDVAVGLHRSGVGPQEHRLIDLPQTRGEPEDADRHEREPDDGRHEGQLRAWPGRKGKDVRDLGDAGRRQCRRRQASERLGGGVHAPAQRLGELVVALALRVDRRRLGRAVVTHSRPPGRRRRRGCAVRARL
jgi:hypothetical protein